DRQPHRSSQPFSVSRRRFAPSRDPSFAVNHRGRSVRMLESQIESAITLSARELRDRRNAKLFAYLFDSFSTSFKLKQHVPRLVAPVEIVKLPVVVNAVRAD